MLPDVTKTVPKRRHVDTEMYDGTKCNVIPIPVSTMSRNPTTMKRLPMIFIITPPNVTS